MDVTPQPSSKELAKVQAKEMDLANVPGRKLWIILLTICYEAVHDMSRGTCSTKKSENKQTNTHTHREIV